MNHIFQLKSTVSKLSDKLFTNSNLFTLEEGELIVMNDSLGDNISPDSLEYLRTMFSDLVYATAYYAVGNVFRSVNTEAYRKPMDLFIQNHFINNSASSLRKLISRKTLSTLLSSSTDSVLNQLVRANSSSGYENCLSIFIPTIDALSTIIRDSLFRLPSFDTMTLDLTIDRNFEFLKLELGVDIRDIMFDKLYPKGYYDGVEISPKGKNKYHNDTAIFNAYCIGSTEED